MNQTVREFFASGEKGGFAQQLLRTYDDPCDSNFRLLRAVADGRNSVLVDRAEEVVQRCFIHPHAEDYSKALRNAFPMLDELDREFDPSDCARLPREEAEGETNANDSLDSDAAACD